MPSHAIGNGHSVMRPPRQQQSRLHSLNGIFGTDTHSAGEFVTHFSQPSGHCQRHKFFRTRFAFQRQLCPHSEQSVKYPLTED
jgi:hypothetical protein